MPDEATKFLIFCLEEYKASKHLSGKEVLQRFNQHGATDFILQNHEALHCDSVDGIIWQIDEFINHHSA
jgi:hypothetical protein